MLTRALQGGLTRAFNKWLAFCEQREQLRSKASGMLSGGCAAPQMRRACEHVA